MRQIKERRRNFNEVLYFRSLPPTSSVGQGPLEGLGVVVRVEGRERGTEQINYQGDAKDRSALQGNGKRNAHIPVSHLLSPIPSVRCSK